MVKRTLYFPKWETATRNNVSRGKQALVREQIRARCTI